ncbi:MAG: hypothetical protein ABSH38_08075 [Verrucomicrobiota bacterium]|jgi:hypothetical protein
MATAGTFLSWSQVVDDGLKIGLAALIGGLSALLVAWINNRSNIQKLQFERRTKMLTDAAQLYEALFQSFLKYSWTLPKIAAMVATSVKENAVEVKRKMVADKASEGVQLRMHMMEKLQESLSAQWLFIVLKEEACKERAAALHQAITYADESYKFDGKSYDLTRFDETSIVVRDAREEFFKEMQKAFDRRA